MPDTPEKAGPALLVFVRAPRIGEVKTRLAAEIGESEALRVYRRLGLHAAQAARAVAESAALRVHYTPADGAAEVAAWLGDDLRLLPQSPGDLGDRMSAAFAAAFAEGYSPV